MSLDIGKWIRGWHLERVFQSHPPAAEISVQAASQKAIDFLTNVQTFLNTPDVVLLAILLPQNWEDEVTKVKELIPVIISDLEAVKVLTDIPVALQDYRFAQDDARNKLYHDIVTSAALIFSDGKLSISDAAIAIKLINDWK